MNSVTKVCFVFLVLIKSFLCTQVAVFTLEKSPLTATEGSCTEIKCSTVKWAPCQNLYWFWMKDAVYDQDKKDFNATVIFSTDNTSRPVSPGFASRVIDIHSLKCNENTFSSDWCSIRICNLSKTDSGNYSARIVSRVSPTLKWKTIEVNLKVKENPCLITFEKPTGVKENNTVILTCSTLSSCTSDLQIFGLTQLPQSTVPPPSGNDPQKNKTVRFTASWQDDGKEFSCQTHDNEDPYLVKDFALTVEYAPKEIEAKISPEIIKEGEPVTLTCSAKGHPLPEFSWFKNEEMFRGPEWKIESIEVSQSGEYYCQVKNIHGTQKSNPVVIDVTYVPQVEVKMTSSDADIIEGYAFRLSCDVKRSKPPPLTYFWKKDEMVIGHEISLSVNPIKLEHDGSYTCSATNTAGTGTSVARKITVQYKPRKPQISIREGTTQAKINKSFTVYCNTDANPKPYAYSWYRYNIDKQTKLPQLNAGNFFDNSLHFLSVQREDEAFYQCNATNIIGTGVYSDEIRIIVLYPPTIVMFFMDTEVEEGQLVTINCTVDSYPASTLTLKKTSTLASEGRQNSLQHEFRATSTDSGFYSCYARYSEGYINSEERELVVKYHPKYVKVEADPDFVVNENTLLRMNCRADSHPPVTSVTWMKMIDGKNQVIDRGQKDLSISLSVKSSDSGLYSCAATNEIGRGTSPSAEVKVKYAPKHIKITRGEEQQHPDGKRSVKLSCSSHCYPKVKEYSWYKKTKPDVPDIKMCNCQNLTVHSHQPGTYYCIAKNEINEKMSEPVELFVDRGYMKFLWLFLIVLILIVLFIFVYRHKSKKSIQQGNTNTPSCFGFLCCWNHSRKRNLINEPVMAEPYRSRDDLLPDQPCRPNGQRRQPPPDSTPASNISSVYCTVNPPAGNQGPSAQNPIRQPGGHTEDKSLSYASLYFEKKKKNKREKAEENTVYAMVSKQKPPKKGEEILGDYENISAAHTAKSPDALSDDSETSEDEVELNYTQVSFKAKSGHQRAHKDSSSETSSETNSETSSDSSTSDEEATQYSEVKL